MSPEFYVEMAIGLAVDQAIGFAEAQVDDDEAYQEAVLAGIAAIQEGIEDIKSEIDQLAKEIKFRQQWINAGNPINSIQAKYDEFVRGDVPSDLSGAADDLVDYITAIHLAVCGEQSGYGKTVDLYLDTLDDSRTDTSRVEKAYSYFTGVILDALLKGLAVLRSYDQDRFTTWYDAYKNGTPGASEEYLKQPMLAYQGKMFQESIDALPESAHWVGRSDTHMWSYDTSTFKVGTELVAPEGCALVGIDFCLDGNGNLILQAWHGKPNAAGYVDSPVKANSVGGTSTPFAPEGSSANLFFIDERAKTAPGGHVVTGVKWSQSTAHVEDDLPDSTVFALLIQHAPVSSDGSIDSSEAAWTTFDLDPMEAGSLSAYSVSSSRGFTHWTDYQSATAPERWNVPITGVQCYGNKAAFKPDYHRKSFGLTDS